MQPILFEWRGRRVHSYPAMLFAGLVAGVFAGDMAAHAARMDAVRVYVANCILIIPALLGARLLHVVLHWRVYRQTPRRIWGRGEAGAAQYGGLLLALPLSVLVTKVLRIPLAAFWDVATFTILIAMIFGRVGCLLNGCCAGCAYSGWGSMYLRDQQGVRKKRVPAQCMEAGWAAILLVCAIANWHRMPFPGALFLAGTAGYATGRLALEFTRERQSGAPRITPQHWISAALIVFSVAILTVLWTN